MIDLLDLENKCKVMKIRHIEKNVKTTHIISRKFNLLEQKYQNLFVTSNKTNKCY